jgi:hypothetical protein
MTVAALESAADRHRRDGTGGSEARATPPSLCPAVSPAPEWRAGRTPNRSARTGRHPARAARPAAGRSRPRRERSARRPSRPRARNGRERAAQLGSEGRERLAERSRPPDDHERSVRRGRLAGRAIRLAQPATSPVASDRTSDLPAHRETCPTRLGRLAPQHDHRRPVDALATLEEGLKISAGGQPVSPREPARQTVSRFRPFARRRFNTFRPPFVFIRSRKPCVFFRRRTLG